MTTRRQRGRKRNIVLVGPMGTGKSRVGYTLARELGWRFVDTDRFLEKQEGERMAQIAERVGTDGLATLEDAVIDRVRGRYRTVISVGGNFVLRHDVLAKLREFGTVFLFTAADFRLVERVGRRVGKRPTMDYDHIESCVREMNRQWRACRHAVDHVFTTTYRSPQRIVRDIQHHIKKRGLRFVEPTQARRYGRKGEREHGHETGGTHERR